MSLQFWNSKDGEKYFWIRRPTRSLSSLSTWVVIMLSVQRLAGVSTLVAKKYSGQQTRIVCLFPCFDYPVWRSCIQYLRQQIAQRVWEMAKGTRLCSQFSQQQWIGLEKGSSLWRTTPSFSPSHIDFAGSLFHTTPWKCTILYSINFIQPGIKHPMHTSITVIYPKSKHWRNMWVW